MKTLLGLAFATALIAFGPAQATASAQTLPVSGMTGTVNGTANTFAGTFNIQKFGLNSTGQLVAIGVLSGTATNSATGAVTSTSAIASAIVSSAGAASCPILTLNIGAIHLDLLGLVIDTNPINLNITAQPGPGNLLGNLLCDIANLLNGTPSQQLVTLLNDLLLIIGKL